MEITKKEMRKEIEEYYASIPEAQVDTGIYLDKVGYKYVYLLDTWYETSIEKVELEEFYNEHIA
jgi:hypothetical protein